MKLLRGRRPSPALLISMLALVLALAGTAIAFNPTKKNVKNVAKKQATKVFDSKIGGATVTKATSADTATTAANSTTTGGQTVHKLFTKIATGTGATTVLQVQGLTLSVACAGGNIQFSATTSVNNSDFGSTATNGGAAPPPPTGGVRSSNFDIGATLNVISGLTRGTGTFTYSQPNGAYVSGTFLADDSNTFDDFDGCVVVGSATSGPA